MFFIIIFFYLLLILCILSVLKNVNIFVRVGTVLVVLVCVHNFYKKQTYSNERHLIPVDNVTVDQAYHFLQEGDVVFIKNYQITDLNLFFIYHNLGRIHALVVIEENGHKYIIHSTKVEKRFLKSQLIFQTYTNWVEAGVVWNNTKQSLFEYLLRTPYLIEVFRPPTNSPKINKNTIYKTRRNMTFCTCLVGQILAENKIISPSKKILTSYYQTDELIEKLQTSGFTSFLFKTIHTVN
jgi:hypothetical protein